MQNNDKDIVLVERLLADDIGAFDMLFDIYSKKLFTFSMKYLKSESDAEELVQEVFVKIWEKRNTLKRDSSFKSYIFTIAYNDILKFFRRKSYHQAYVCEAIKITEEKDNSEDGIYYSFVLEQIDNLIDQLPERRKTIFIKSRREGLSSKEIAKELGISSGTVDNNISEVMKFLKNNLDKDAIGSILFFFLFI